MIDIIKKSKIFNYFQNILFKTHSRKRSLSCRTLFNNIINYAFNYIISFSSCGKVHIDFNMQIINNGSQFIIS